MRILLTGATGFIGQAFCRHIAQQEGIHLYAAIRNGKFPYHLPSGVAPVRIDDITHTEALSPVLIDAQVVVHLAGSARLPCEDNADSKEKLRRLVVQGTENLAREAAKSGVTRFIFVSTVKVHGETSALGKPFSHHDVPAPEDAYAAVKYEAERVLRQIALETGMEVVIIRPPLVYGPGVKGNFAQLMRLVSLGVPLPFGAVSNQRSLLALENLVDFIALCAVPARSPEAANQTFLLSDGDDVSTAELVHRIAKSIGVTAHLLPVPLGLVNGAARVFGKSELARRLLGSLQVDASKARTLLGWLPPVSMSEQLQQMVNPIART